MVWDTSCLDWEKRIAEGRSLVPALPLFEAEKQRALRVFKRLRLPDVIGTPTMAEAAGNWFLDVVAAVFGSYDVETNRRIVQEFFLLVPKKNGKALALDTDIATPSGFVKMRDIEPGDCVIGQDGQPAKVLWKSPVYINHDCYEVEFSTGEKVICDAGHLWLTDSHIDRGKQKTRKVNNRKNPCPRVKTTEEIANSLTVPSGNYEINNHRTYLCQPLDLPEQDLPIPPYALGAWLGDGTSSQSAMTCSVEDSEGVIQQLVANGQPAYVRCAKADGRSVTIQLGIPDTRTDQTLNYRFYTQARKLNLLNNKHIPQIYLRSSYEQRLALLRGLMDTDGTISSAGQATFTTTAIALRDGFLELVNSLGLKGSVQEKRAKLYGKDCGLCWNIQFWPFDNVPVFTLKRKLDRQRKSEAVNSARSKTRQIVGAKRVPSVPVQCIAVDNESKQFLITRSLIPTHNSSYAAAVMLTAIIVNRRPNAEYLLIAPTKEIAGISFKQARNTIKLDPELTKLFQIQDHLKIITHRRTGAVLQIKAAATDVITGSKATGILVDETHEFALKSNAANLFVEIRGSLAARPDGFMFQISTQSKDPPVGVFRAELGIAREVRDGKMKLPLLPVIYELPQTLSADNNWKNPHLWPLVNPNLGLSVDVGYLERELLKAEREGPHQLALLASQHFNVEIGLNLRSDRWTGADWWKAAAIELTLEDLIERSEVIVVGIDGGGLDDFLGLTVIGREYDGRTWISWSKAWVHPSALEQRVDQVSRFLDFERDGDLVIVPDLPQDIEELADIVSQIEQTGKLDKIGVDRAGIGGIIDALSERDISGDDKVVAVPQGWRLNGAIKTVERKLSDGSFLHADQKLMDYCVSNAKIEVKGNAISITKQIAGKAKIDPLIALLCASSLMSLHPETTDRSIYEDQDLRIL